MGGFVPLFIYIYLYFIFLIASKRRQNPEGKNGFIPRLNPYYVVIPTRVLIYIYLFPAGGSLASSVFNCQRELGQEHIYRAGLTEVKTKKKEAFFVSV